MRRRMSDLFSDHDIAAADSTIRVLVIRAQGLANCAGLLETRRRTNPVFGDLSKAEIFP